MHRRDETLFLQRPSYMTFFMTCVFHYYRQIEIENMTHIGQDHDKYSLLALGNSQVTQTPYFGVKFSLNLIPYMYQGLSSIIIGLSHLQMFNYNLMLQLSSLEREQDFKMSHLGMTNTPTLASIALIYPKFDGEYRH